MIGKIIGNLFYKKPQSLGEGLARVKKHINAGPKNYSAIPGKRTYSYKGKGVIYMDVSNSRHRGLNSIHDTSRLTIRNAESNTQYIVDYVTFHDYSVKEARPYRYRTVSKLQQIAYRKLSDAAMFFERVHK